MCHFDLFWKCIPTTAEKGQNKCTSLKFTFSVWVISRCNDNNGDHYHNQSQSLVFSGWKLPLSHLPVSRDRPLNALIIVIKGTQCVHVCVWMCVCVSMWLTLWPPTTLPSQPLKGAPSQSGSSGTIEPEWALRGELQQPVSAVWQGFLCSPRTLCVSVGPSWPIC